MIDRIPRHEKVEDDILDLASWIARDNKPVAFRFLEAVESTLSDLRLMPKKGSRTISSFTRLCTAVENTPDCCALVFHNDAQ